MHPHLLSAIAHITEMLFIIALIAWIAEHRRKLADMLEKHKGLEALIGRVENAYHADIEKIKDAVPEVKAAFAKEKTMAIDKISGIKEVMLKYTPILWAVLHNDWEAARLIAKNIIYSKNNNTAMQKQILIVGTPGDPIFYVDNGTVKTANITEVHVTFDIVGGSDPVITHNYVTDLQTAPELQGAKGNTPAQYLTLPVEQVFTSEADATASIQAATPKTLTPEIVSAAEKWILDNYGVTVTNIS